jgi:hypothetical protein
MRKEVRYQKVGGRITLWITTTATVDRLGAFLLQREIVA